MQKQIHLTTEEYYEYIDDSVGFCLTCGENAYGVEPDARGYKCEACLDDKVYGLEELVLMGKVTIV